MAMLNSNQIVSLVKAVGTRKTVLIEGENGIGKTALFERFKQDPDFAGYHFIGPVDCQQMSDGSVWMPDLDREAGVSRELPNERFGVSRNNQKGVAGSKPVFIFLDEIAKIRQFMKDVLAPVIYERRVGNFHMPEGSIVVCATNLTAEGLGDSLQAHFRTRLIKVQMAKPVASEWNAFMQDHPDSNAEVMAFVEEYPNLFDSFVDYEAGGKYAGKDQERDNNRIYNPRIPQDGYASPRTLHTACIVVNQMQHIDNDTLQAALEGTVGKPTAEALAAYIRFGNENPSFSSVVNDPHNAKLAESPTAQIVMVFKLSTSVTTREEAAAATTYVKRMREEMQSLFCRTVGNSTKIALFTTVTPFKDMLAANRIFIA